jgi:ABC-type oligopeptide transport system ATPase subunit
VDFELNQGEILGIVGESGSGKSTLLKVISGIEKPDSGKLYHMGKEYTGQGPEKTGKFLQMIFRTFLNGFIVQANQGQEKKAVMGLDFPLLMLLQHDIKQK